MQLIGTFIVIALCWGLGMSRVEAQGVLVVMDPQKVEIKYDTPPLGPSTGGIRLPSSDPIYGSLKKWLTIAAEIEVEEPELGYVEELTVRVAVEALEMADLKDKEGKPAVLTGEVTYVNVPAKIGRTKHPVFFAVHPFTIDRFGTERVLRYSGATKSKGNFNIRFEVLVNGQVVPLDKEQRNLYVDKLKDESDWVAQTKKFRGMVLPKHETPWMNSWWDAMPMIKPASSGGSR